MAQSPNVQAGQSTRSAMSMASGQAGSSSGSGLSTRTSSSQTWTSVTRLVSRSTLTVTGTMPVRSTTRAIGFTSFRGAFGSRVCRGVVASEATLYAARCNGVGAWLPAERDPVEGVDPAATAQLAVEGLSEFEGAAVVTHAAPEQDVAQQGGR